MRSLAGLFLPSTVRYVFNIHILTLYSTVNLFERDIPNETFAADIPDLDMPICPETVLLELWVTVKAAAGSDSGFMTKDSSSSFLYWRQMS